MQQKEVFACALMMAKVVTRWVGRELPRTDGRRHASSMSLLEVQHCCEVSLRYRCRKCVQPLLQHSLWPCDRPSCLTIAY